MARHPDFPQAFTRGRKLPLPALIGALLSMRNQSQQAMLDGFFASVCGSEALLREVSNRAFAKARDRLYMPALLDELGDGPGGRRPALVRGDSGYGNEGILLELEHRAQPYLLRLRQTANGKRLGAAS